MRWVLCVLMLWPISAAALEVDALGSLPVLHEGRVKPLGTLARVVFAPFETGTMEPVETLAMALFTPADLLEKPLIVIRSDAVRSLLKLPKQEVYSYLEVTPRLRAHRPALRVLAEKEPGQYTANERALWTLYEQIDRLTQLTGAMSLFLPLELSVPETIDRPRLATYYTLAGRHADIRQRVKAMAQEKGEAIDQYREDEQQLIALSMRLDALRATGEGNQLLRVVPAAGNEEWLTPWQAISAAAALDGWQQAAAAYRQRDQAAWNAAMQSLSATTAEHVSGVRLALERLYHQLDLIMLAVALYALALLLACWRARVGQGALLTALGMHAVAIILRIVILARPPVSTLYESVLFVAFVAAAYGAWLGRGGRFAPGTWIGAGLGGFLLAISGLYAGEGDPMAMPIAVLNTNFWLATHVIIITAGYGAALMAGLLAHLALITPNAATWRYLPGAALVALLLTTLGTILGGIWADQSWGRFWGWDPKENGALLIVLWLAWLLHARMTRYVGAGGFATLLAITPVIVALSWFGVNLLGVGLHSYGFTSAAALGLFGFCALELALVTGLYVRWRRRL